MEMRRPRRVPPSLHTGARRESRECLPKTLRSLSILLLNGLAAFLRGPSRYSRLMDWGKHREIRVCLGLRRRWLLPFFIQIQFLMKFPPFFRCPVFLLMAFMCHTVAAGDLRERLRQMTPLTCSHRAVFSEDMAENSLSGIRACAAKGIAMVEIDLMESREGELFLLHDETLDRTTSGSGPLAALSAREISSLALKITGERIPRFREALDLAAKSGIFLMLDVKRAPLAKVWKDVADSGMAGRVLVLTFSEDRALEAFQTSDQWLVSVLVRNEKDSSGYIKMAPDREKLLFYVNQRADLTFFEAVGSNGIPIITDGMRFLDPVANTEGGHHYKNFHQSRRPGILVTDYATLAKSALE